MYICVHIHYTHSYIIEESITDHPREWMRSQDLIMGFFVTYLDLHKAVFLLKYGYSSWFSQFPFITIGLWEYLVSAPQDSRRYSQAEYVTNGRCLSHLWEKD